MLESSVDDAQGPAKLEAGLAAFGTMSGFLREVRGTSEATEIAAQSCWATMHGLVSLLLTRPHFPWANREELVRHHLSVACAAALSLELKEPDLSSKQCSFSATA